MSAKVGTAECGDELTRIRASVLPTTLDEILARIRQGEIGDEWPVGWWDDPLVWRAHHVLWREAMDATPPCPEKFEGRGVVICAGGRFFECGWVCMRLLRRFGCALPIEFWHLGPEELDARRREMLLRWDVRCVDALKLRVRHPMRILRGWELKAYAIVHCRFREVLLLDADNCPVRDPTYLFDEAEYVRAGAAFWPDYGRLGPERALWTITEVPFRDEPECETGQILVDKRRTWAGLWLALAFNAHSDFYYHHTMGDKDSFHLAFRRLGIDYAMPATPIENLGDLVMCQHDFQGRRMFQHRNMDKWRLDGENARIEGFEHDELCREALSECRIRNGEC